MAAENRSAIRTDEWVYLDETVFFPLSVRSYTVTQSSLTYELKHD